MGDSLIRLHHLIMMARSVAPGWSRCVLQVVTGAVPRLSGAAWRACLSHMCVPEPASGALAELDSVACWSAAMEAMQVQGCSDQAM